jgi:hypothetical protein
MTNVRSRPITAAFVVIMAFAVLLTGCDTLVAPEADMASATHHPDLRLNQTQDGGDLAPVCQAVLLDLALVIDVSGSMSAIVPGTGKTRLQLAKDGAKALVEELTDNHQGALISFHTWAGRVRDLTLMDADGRANLNAAIDGLALGNLTNTQAGVIFAAEELTGNEALFTRLLTNPSGKHRVEAVKIMVVLADGVSNAYYDAAGIQRTGTPTAGNEALLAAGIAKGEGIRILTIAIGEADFNFMKDLASSEADAFVSAAIGDLVEVFKEIAAAICPQEVDIDIKPGSDPNSININNNGVVPVAVFTTDDFDATKIDPATVRFGALDALLNGVGASLEHSGGHFEDVNKDGRLDFVGHFRTQDTGFTTDDDLGWLLGETIDGVSFAGRDAIRILDRGKR